MNKLILLADDSPDDELVFKRVLEAAGVRNPVCAVRDGAEAISYLRGDAGYADRENFPLPAILFLDLMMPRSDGWDVLRWLQTQPHLRHILVFVLTGSAQRQRLREVYALGANSFLFKPLKKEELAGLIKHWPDAWITASSEMQRSQSPPTTAGPEATL